jgi:hypothetical protein
MAKVKEKAEAKDVAKKSKPQATKAEPGLFDSDQILEGKLENLKIKGTPSKDAPAK